MVDANLGALYPAGTLTVARTLASAVTLNDGSMLIVGGRDANNNPLASAEVFRMEERRRAASH